jgi:hypothetical protein
MGPAGVDIEWDGQGDHRHRVLSLQLPTGVRTIPGRQEIVAPGELMAVDLQR